MHGQPSRQSQPCWPIPGMGNPRSQATPTRAPHSSPPPHYPVPLSLLLSVPRLTRPLQVSLPPSAPAERSVAGWSLVPCAVPTLVFDLL